jgi:hypothetical protein
MERHERIRKHYERVGVLPSHGVKGGFEILRILRFHRLNAQAQCRRCILCKLEVSANKGQSGIPQNRHAGNLGNRLTNQLQLLGRDLRARVEGCTREVSAWPGETGHEPLTDRISRCCEDDRDRGGGVPSRSHGPGDGDGRRLCLEWPDL